MSKIVGLDSTEAVESAARSYGFDFSDYRRLDSERIYLDQVIIETLRSWWERRKKREDSKVIYVDWQKKEPAVNYWSELARNQIWMMEVYLDNNKSNGDLDYQSCPEFMDVKLPSLGEYIHEICPMIIRHIAENYSPSIAADLERRLKDFKREVVGLRLVR